MHPKFSPHIRLLRRPVLIGLTLLLLIFGAATAWQVAQARPTDRTAQQTSPIHPHFPLLDEDGVNVLESGGAVSTMQTCGACHDTEFIVEHSFHADAGLDEISAPGTTPSGRPWDISPGFFGKWNPIGYRYLSTEADQRVDLTTPEWLQFYGIRHVGGGPAVYSREGQPLTELPPDAGNPETSIHNPETGELLPWNWQESGVVEMNCFLCHTPSPNTEARAQALHEGNFRWANTATLLGSGIVTVTQENGFIWNPEAFNEAGELTEGYVTIQGPANTNCGLCHGLVHDNVEDPLAATGCSPERWSTITTGQIISPQRLSASGLNLADKDNLDRTWDIHAERLLQCTDCHYSLNNPLYYQEPESSRPDHLLFDPRRLDIGEYLQKPLHQFARGDSAQDTVAPELKDTMRRCESCHSVESTHDWLPYKNRHMQAVSCESCHIPKLYSSANMQHDWTVLTLESNAHTECRGVEGDVGEVSSLLTGYEPVLLPRKNVDGEVTLTPHNLISTWFWVYGNPPRPVRLADLQAVYFENGNYHPGILLRFDANQDGQLDKSELVIDTPEKEEFVKKRLEFLGLSNPRIVGEVQPYSINHNVAAGEWVTKDCETCHSDQSRITQPLQLAAYLPGGVMPQFVQDSNVLMDGEMYQDENGALYYQPGAKNQTLYVLGHNSIFWVDALGVLMFVGVLGGIIIHGGLRVYTVLKKGKPAHQTEKVYMYAVYERLWHWLQATAIVLLLFTGLIIHKPELFRALQFQWMVAVHNALALVLVINAGLALFYHLVSGEIKQYLPRPRGFFDQAITQAMYYLKGIFRGEEHPFEKRPEQKLNPLQQITYFGILNALLPLQIITGLLIWGAQYWPDIAGLLGGLPFLAPFHTLTAWMFASFIVMHIYLTTTGPTPLEGIQAMITGWEDIEIPAESHPLAEEAPKA